MRATCMVRLNEGDLLKAATWAAQVEKRLKPTPNYTGLTRDGRFFVGYLGELGVGRLLTQFDIWHSHRVSLSGRSDKSEFIVHDRAAVNLEVKTAGEPRYRRLMMPAAQYDHSAAYIVAARIERTDEYTADISILGWISGEEALSLEIGTFGEHNIPTRSIEYEKMKPMSELLCRLAPVQRVDRAAA